MADSILEGMPKSPLLGDAVYNTAVAGDKMGFTAKATGLATAALVDIGTTMFNSLTPNQYNVHTEDLLRSFSPDAYQMYNANTEAVKAASFVGSIIAPVGGSMKLMGMLRSGSKNTSWYGNAASASDRAKVASDFSRGNEGLADLRAANRLYYGRIGANAVADNLAAEVAILVTVNAHPYMQDYLKDPASNFALSMSIGTGIQFGLGSIIARRALVKDFTVVEKQATTILAGNVKAHPVNVTEALTVQLVNRGQRVDNLQAHIDSARSGGNPSNLSSRTIESLEAAKIHEQGRMIDTFEAMVPEEIARLPKESRDFYLDLARTPGFVGAEKMSFATVRKEELAAMNATDEIVDDTLRDKWNLLRRIIPKSGKKAGQARIVDNSAVYSPIHGAWMAPSDKVKYLTVADMGKTIKELQSEARSTLGLAPRPDQSLLNQVGHTAVVDEDYAIAMLSMSKATPEELAKKTIAPDDLPILKAAYARLSRLIEDRAPGAEVITIKLSVTRAEVLRETTAKMVAARTGNAIDLKSVPLSANPADNKLISYGANELLDHINLVTISDIRTMIKMDMSPETIALRTGSSTDSIKEFIAVPDRMPNFIKYSSVADVQQANAITNRAINVSANVERANSLASITVAMNARTADSISQGVIEATILSSPSPLVSSIAQVLTTPEILTQIHFLIKKLEGITPAALRSTFFRSADSVVENLGEAGMHLTALGKQRIHIGNTVIEKITNPMSKIFTAVAKSIPERIEFNTAIQLNQGQAGFRFYHERQFWTSDRPFDLDKLVGLDLRDLPELGKLLGLKIDTVLFNGKQFRVVADSVDSALKMMQESGRDMYHLANAHHLAIGAGNLSDIGFWSPAFNTKNKLHAYIVDATTGRTTMILAKTADELKTAASSYKTSLGANARNVHIIYADQQEAFNKAASRHDALYMDVVDSSKQKTGSAASTQVSVETDVMVDIINGYDDSINRSIDRIFQLQLAPLLDQFKILSDISQTGYVPDTLGKVAIFSKKPKDPGQILKNIMLGRSNLSQHEGWASFQNGSQWAMDLGLKVISDTFTPILAPLFAGKGHTKRTPEEWARTIKEQEDRGMVNPWQVYDNHSNTWKVDYAVGQAQFLKKTAEGESLSPRLVSLGNALSATSLLRFGDLAQPLVNILSLPILTSSAIRREFASELAGTALDTKRTRSVFTVASAMTDGVRLMNSPYFSKWEKLATESGMFSREWQEMNGIVRQSRQITPGTMTAVADAMESTLVRWMSTAADRSEELVRRTAFATAIGIAKRAYPGISDAGVMTFARDFMDKSIGNYTAAQRPAMFQGTVGMAMGLFQTYMLTYAQNMFRHIEQKEFRALGTMMLLQGNIFGAASLPGFSLVSETIGKHFSEDHYDLESGTFRAIEDPVASIILYGLPSQLVNIHTRGDIQPRVPNISQGVNSIAAVNLTKQVLDAGERVAKAAFAQDGNAGVALLEAVSLQSISRPLARWSELLTGHSITKSGDIVSMGAEMYTTQSLISRAFATRPLEEAKARDALHLDNLYGGIDIDRRKEVIVRLKSHIRDTGNKDGEVIDKLANEYLKSGTPAGWRSAVNTAIFQADSTGNAVTTKKLGPDSIHERMIDGLDY